MNASFVNTCISFLFLNCLNMRRFHPRSFFNLALHYMFIIPQYVPMLYINFILLICQANIFRDVHKEIHRIGGKGIVLFTQKILLSYIPSVCLSGRHIYILFKIIFELPIIFTYCLLITKHLSFFIIYYLYRLTDIKYWTWSWI